MKYFPLIWAALWRNPAETLLTWLAATVAFTLFGLMVGLYVHTQRVVDLQRMDRLYVVMRYPDQPYTGLPIALKGSIAAIMGVTGVGAAHNLNGYHADPKFSVQVVAADEGMPDGWPELPMSAADWKILFSTPGGVFASRIAAQRWNLRPGDSFQVTAPGDPQADGNSTRIFQILGIIGDVPDRDQGYFLGNYHYVDNSEPLSRRGLGTTFLVAVADPHRASQICHMIDQKFANSGTPTFCVPAKADAEAMAHSTVDIGLLTMLVAGSGLFMILFLIANGIARSVTERIPEFAVLKTVGFTETHIMAFVILEAATPCLLGASIGTGFAYLLGRLSAHISVGELTRLVSAPGFSLPVLCCALAIAVLLTLFSSIVPIVRLRNLGVVNALAER